MRPGARQVRLAHGQRLGLRAARSAGAVTTDEQANEITAVPKLLGMLSLMDTTVMLDALNRHRAIARQIVDQGGDSVPAPKDKPKTLHNVFLLFLDDSAMMGVATVQTVDARPIVAGSKPAPLRFRPTSTGSWTATTGRGCGLSGKIERIGEGPDNTTRETSHFVLSAALSADRFPDVIRFHRGVEN